MMTERFFQKGGSDLAELLPDWDYNAPGVVTYYGDENDLYAKVVDTVEIIDGVGYITREVWAKGYAEIVEISLNLVLAKEGGGEGG